MVAMKTFNSQLLSKHLYFEVTIQLASCADVVSGRGLT
jgi:hypothetical protein